MSRRAVVLVALVLLGAVGLAVWLSMSRGVGDDAPSTATATAPAPDVAEGVRVRTPRPALPEAPGGATDDTAPVAPVSTLVVRVVAGPSDPVAGAAVSVDPEDGASHDAVTDAAGVAQFDGLTPGDATVRVRADGYIRHDAEMSLLEDGSALLDVRLTRGVVVEGTVREERTERVIAGAHVVVTPGGSVGGAFMMRTESAFGEAETDARGRYRVDGIEPGAIVTVRATAAGHSAAQESVILEPDSAEPRQVDLHLAPAGSVRGIVRYHDGDLAVGAQVYVIPADSPDMLRVNPTMVSMSDGKTYRALRGEAGADGAFAIGGLDLDAAYALLAIVEGRGRTDVHEGVMATALEPEVTFDLTVLPPASVLVRLLDPVGEPHADGYLDLFGDGFPVRLEAGEPGEFTAAAPPPGHYTLRVTCPNMVIQEIPVDVVAGESQEIDVRLDRGLSLTGVLVDDADVPIAGQTIVIDRHWTDAEKYPMSAARVTTDDEGRFSVAGLCEGPHGLIIVLGRHDVPDALRLEPSPDEVRIVVYRRASLRARLRLPAGSAAAETVSVRVVRNEGGGVSSSGVSSEWSDGELLVENLSVEASAVTIRVPGYLEIVRDVQLAAGTTLDLGELVLEPGFDLAGRVLDRAGGPVAGAQVSTGMIWTPSHQVVATDRDGRFTLRGIDTREASIEVDADDFLARSVEVPLPQTGPEWTVTLDAGCLLTLHVTDGAKKPAAGVNVRFTPISDDGELSEDEYDTSESDHRGLIQTRLPAGNWRIEALDGEWEPLVAQDVELAEGGTEEVWMTLPR